VVLPRINELEARNAPRDILILVAAAARKLALVYLPGYALFMVLGREIVQVMFTSRYVAAWPILAVSMTLDPLTIIVLDPVTRAFELRYFFLVLRLCIFGVLLFVLWHYTAALGMVGVMATVVFSYFIVWAVAVVRMARLLHARRTDVALFADVGRIVLISATAAVITAVVRHWVGVESPLAVLLVCGPVFVLTYVVGIVQLGVLRRDEVRRLRQEVWRSVFGRARHDAALQAGSAASPNQSPVRSGP
jgi:O-antigen/teichoic acid export membrane protein